MPNAPKPEREFCTNCGFPMRGTRCDACGASREPAAHEAAPDAPLRHSQLRPNGADFDAEGLERAIEAYRLKDLPRFVDQVVLVEGGPATRPQTLPEGPGWIAVVRGAFMFISLRAASDELLVDVPLVRVPQKLRIPALRYALELAAAEPVGARIALRNDVLLLRLWSRLSAQTPVLLRQTLRELGQLATRYIGLFAVGFSATAAFNEEQRAAATFDSLGRSKKMQIGGGRRSVPPPVASPAPDPSGRRPSGAARQVPLRREEETSSPKAMDWNQPSESIPAILAPAFAGPASSGNPDRRAVTAGGSDLGRRGPSSVSGAKPLSGPEVELDAFSRRGSPQATTADTPMAAPDRLCAILRQAQGLAQLVLDERPATMTWLVRSTIFRAVYEFRDTLPDAVAHLYRCTGVARDMPTSGRQTAPVVPEPPLVVLERVVVARGIMPKERPLAIEPMTTALQAKEHVARYLQEIDKSPSEPALRHYLALGALTELLTRTKLPAQTDQRLRDIVTHAQREGAKGNATELMMTALQRING